MKVEKGPGNHRKTTAVSSAAGFLAGRMEDATREARGGRQAGFMDLFQRRLALVARQSCGGVRGEAVIRDS